MIDDTHLTQKQLTSTSLEQPKSELACAKQLDTATKKIEPTKFVQKKKSKAYHKVKHRSRKETVLYWLYLHW